eukprot:6207502-Pleurochrysis_carterae.AAC.1
MLANAQSDERGTFGRAGDRERSGQGSRRWSWQGQARRGAPSQRGYKSRAPVASARERSVEELFHLLLRRQNHKQHALCCNACHHRVHALESVHLCFSLNLIPFFGMRDDSDLSNFIENTKVELKCTSKRLRRRAGRPRSRVELR